jgi:putative endonuclease
MKGWMYILLCGDGSYYTGSTNNLYLRLHQHKTCVGSNHTARRQPVELIYFEEFDRVQDAFLREKQIQGWSRKKKEALINNNLEALKIFSSCYKEIYENIDSSSGRFKNIKNHLTTIKEKFNLEDTHISEILEYITMSKSPNVSVTKRFH